MAMKLEMVGKLSVAQHSDERVASERGLRLFQLGLATWLVSLGALLRMVPYPDGQLRFHQRYGEGLQWECTGLLQIQSSVSIGL